MKTILLNDIEADESMNCRGYIDLASIQDLATLIKESGQLQPVLVCNRTAFRELNKLPKESGPEWYLVAGFRRYKACKSIKDKMDILAIEIPPAGLDDIQVTNLNENLGRENLNMLQEANVVQRLHDRGVAVNWIAAKLNKPQAWVKARLQLKESPEYIQQAAADGFINSSHIKRLYSVAESPEAQEQLFKRFMDKKENRDVRPIKKEGLDKKKTRNEQETLEMLEFMIQATGATLGTRALAWQRGTISDGELFEDMKEYNKITGREFEFPSVSLRTYLELRKAKEEGRKYVDHN